MGFRTAQYAKYSTVCEGGCKLMAAWVREEETASENRLRKREAERTPQAALAVPIEDPENTESALL